VRFTFPGMKKTVLCLIWFVLLLGISQAQGETGISNDNPESRTLALQNKVDRLYDRGEFKRAYFIYRNELVPLGDKYAQYMVGYMLLTGTGVDEDPVSASAWYRLVTSCCTISRMTIGAVRTISTRSCVANSATSQYSWHR